jgi:glutamate racemase
MIGVFDSGVGGLSVWKELHALMPEEDYSYFSDSAYCPYGPKLPEAIQERAAAITDFLISKGSSIVVVACNTATAAAIDFLRSRYAIPFVGMEPAVKPAAEQSKSGTVGVLATAGTLKGSLYHNTLANYASSVNVIETVGTGLVELVESGKTDSPEAFQLVSKYVKPMVEAGADCIVLGCTHYPFLADVISKVAGPGVEILNPAPAVARQTRRLLPRHFPKGSKGSTQFFSSSDPTVMEMLVRRIDPAGTYAFEGNVKL